MNFAPLSSLPMSNTWKAQDAKARFSELLEAATMHGPQIVTQRGVEVAVVLSVDYWRRLEMCAKPGLKEVLLAPMTRSEALVGPRRKRRQPQAAKFVTMVRRSGGGRA
jgi:prevent-host-death family protein